MPLSLPDRVVPNVGAAQRNFEYITGHGLSDKDGLQLAVTGTGRKVAFGTQTMTWPGGVQNLAVVVTHGLGATPASVTATSGVNPNGLYYVAVGITAIGATTFTINLWAPVGAPGAATADPVSWVAVG